MMRQGTATALETESQADALEERLINFAVRIVKLSASLPKTSAGRHISGQILRSGTSENRESSEGNLQMTNVK